MGNKKRRFAIMIILLIVFWGTSYAFMQDVDPYPHDLDAEWKVLTELNHWRVRRGLVPLARNADLDYLAEGQALYIIPLAPFTTKKVDFHTDQYGEGVAKRAELFDWTGYDTPDRVLVSEIAAYYPDVAGAINFWQNSPVHRASVETGGYREAGVAVLQFGNWRLSYVVLGGRPDVLPVLYDPVRSTFFMTTDQSWFTDHFRPTKVQFLDDSGQRIHETEWLPWANKIRLTAGLTQNMTVIVTDGIKEVHTAINLFDNQAFPSDPLPIRNTPTPRPTLPLPVSTLVPTIAPLNPTPSPTPMNTSFMVKITWDDESLTLVNQARSPIDLTRLVLVSRQLGFQKTGRWMGTYSKAPLDAFPPHYCIQLWSLEYSLGAPDLPQDCETLASGRSVLKAGERFWMTRSFDVKYNNEIIATCDSRMEICEFDLPSD